MNAIEQLKSTLRHNRSKDWRQESVAEHTRRLAILFILVQDCREYDIDVMKTLKMILIHDIPEVFDWDVPGFLKEKSSDFFLEKETIAAEKIFSILPKEIANEYFNLFVEYGEWATKEAQLAKALDKIETNLQHLNSGPEYWCEEEKGEHMLTYPDKALAKLNDPFVASIWIKIKNELSMLT